MQFPGRVPLYWKTLHSADPEHLNKTYLSITRLKLEKRVIPGYVVTHRIGFLVQEKVLFSVMPVSLFTEGFLAYENLES